MLRFFRGRERGERFVRWLDSAWLGENLIFRSRSAGADWLAGESSTTAVRQFLGSTKPPTVPTTWGKAYMRAFHRVKIEQVFRPHSLASTIRRNVVTRDCSSCSEHARSGMPDHVSTIRRDSGRIRENDSQDGRVERGEWRWRER